MNSKNVGLHPTLSKMISEYFLNWMNLRKFAATALLLHICCTGDVFSNFGYAFYADSILRLIPGPVWFKTTSKTSCTWPSRPSWPDLAAQRRTTGFLLLQLSEVKLLRFFLSKSFKVHIFWEGHKILKNLHLTFDYSTYSQKLSEDFAKFCGLLKIYEL